MNTLILDVKGKNIDNFITKIYHNNISILKIKYIKYNEINIEIYDKDYDKLIKIKSIYEINIKQYKGIKKIKRYIKFNKYMIISLIIGCILFYILTNMIFKIDIVYSSNSIRQMVKEELNYYGIKEYTMAKSFDELDNIKNKILEDKKDEIEWLMIERVGTKYIVKLEPRKISKNIDDNKIYNVVATKDVIIKSIEASSGEIIHNVNDYVKKGEVVISSDITLNNEIKSKTSARGKVYGEVWYKVTIEYPLNYYEEKETGKVKKLLSFKLFDKDINIGGFKNKKVEDKVLLKSDILPISFNYETEKEIEVINYKLNTDEALKYAMEEGRNKINSTLNDKEYIMDEKCLKIDSKESKIVVDIFYTVYEDVTGYIEIEG